MLEGKWLKTYRLTMVKVRGSTSSVGKGRTVVRRNNLAGRQPKHTERNMSSSRIGFIMLNLSYPNVEVVRMMWNEEKRQKRAHVRTLNDCFLSRGVPAGTHGRVEDDPAERPDSVSILFYPDRQPVGILITNVSREEYESSLVEGDFVTPDDEVFFRK
jgi:hypothetical protein